MTRRFGSGGITLLALALVFGACGVDEDATGAARGDDDGGASADGARRPAAGDAAADEPPAPPVDADGGGEGGPPAPAEESGEATYYDAEGLGSCGIPFPPDYLLAAMNGAQYQKSYCGRCVSVTGPKGTVVVRILDLCPGCKPGGLDLSITAFTKIADKSAGRVPITWHFVDCPF
jgi:hypothetical protein